MKITEINRSQAFPFAILTWQNSQNAHLARLHHDACAICAWVRILVTSEKKMANRFFKSGQIRTHFP